MKQPVIWCLYDDGFGSWNKLKLKNVFSFGINKHDDWENYFQIDLSLNNEKMINQLKKIAKITGYPDAIVAHPPCVSWSKADNQKRMFRSHNLLNDDCLTMTIFKKDFYIRNNINANTINLFNFRRNFHKSLNKFLNGISTIGAIDLIIEEFKPKIFLMENPISSKIFKFCEDFLSWKMHYFKFYYNNFNNAFTPKPTFFISNIKLDLNDYEPIYQPNGKIISFKRINFGRIKGRDCVDDYEIRSSLPKELLLYLYQKIMEELFKQWIIQEVKKDTPEKF